MSKNEYGYIACDLDGTLAYYDGWKGVGHIGKPIEKMVERIKQHLANGDTVKIFTARVAEPNPERLKECIEMIEAWCAIHLGQVLEITNMKDFGMIMLYDDRCRQVEFNTGRIIGEN